MRRSPTTSTSPSCSAAWAAGSQISSHPRIPGPELETSELFTAHLRQLAAFGLVLVGGLSILAVPVPPVVGPTPVDGLEITGPLWMFWWFFSFEEWWGIGSVGIAIGVLFALIFLVPLLDRSPHRRWRERRVTVGAALLILLFLVAITIQVWINNPKGHA
ncbi:hypothetical protein [Kitasatospora sp. P5_F3]